jgi:glyoxylase-like metal-dependent hydrolase (beta-lactamase superfamily II)
LNHGVVDAMQIAFRPMWGMAFTGMLCHWVFVRRNRGRVLIDCGPLPQRWLFIVMARCVTQAERDESAADVLIG